MAEILLLIVIAMILIAVVCSKILEIKYTMILDEDGTEKEYNLAVPLVIIFCVYVAYQIMNFIS